MDDERACAAHRAERIGREMMELFGEESIFSKFWFKCGTIIGTPSIVGGDELRVARESVQGIMALEDN